MLIYVRHGETNLNGPSGSSHERLRGWLPADLTPKGRKQAQATADGLKDFSPKSFYTSDLPRAVETANIISKSVGVSPTPTFNLRDWNTGHFAGQKFPDVKDELFHYIDHPDDTVPEGESLNNYIGRFVPFIQKLVASPDPHLVVGHARGTQVIHALAANNGQWISPSPLKDKPVIDPGGIMVISPDWTTVPDHTGPKDNA